MARIIKTLDCIGIKYDGPRDPARYETQAETRRRLKNVIATLGKTIKFFQESAKKSFETSQKIMSLTAERNKLKKDLESFED